jgi:hypothetical protein
VPDVDSQERIAPIDGISLRHSQREHLLPPTELIKPM